MPKDKLRGEYSKHTEETFNNAISAVKNGMSLRKAAEKFQIPKSTLSNKMTGKTAVGAWSGRKPYLKREVENELVDKVKKASSMGFGTSRRQFLLKVGTLCQKTSVARFKHGAPRKDWYYSF
jgi:transposase